MDFVWIVLLLLLGVLMFLKPELLWKLEHILWVKGGEPTDFYLSMMRLGGIVFVIAAVVIGVYTLL